MEHIKVGVDTGNYDTKTQHCKVASSFERYDKEDLLASELLFYKGHYYAITNTRDNQDKDKTASDLALILTLFGIAKEVIAQAIEPGCPKDQLQNRISQVSRISLGVGVPVGYFSELSRRTYKYYANHFEDGIVFSFKSPETRGMYLNFNLKVEKINVYPQDLLGVIQNPNIEVVKMVSDYYIIGTGGGTVDIIPIKNNVPDTAECVSLPLGTTEMYKKISTYLQKNGSDAKDYGLIEKVIKGEPTFVAERDKELILAFCETFAHKLVENFQNRGLKLRDYPVVFIGGGALLLRRWLENNPAFVKVEFSENVNDNAIYYAMAL